MEGKTNREIGELTGKDYVWVANLLIRFGIRRRESPGSKEENNAAEGLKKTVEAITANNHATSTTNCEAEKISEEAIMKAIKERAFSIDTGMFRSRGFRVTFANALGVKPDGIAYEAKELLGFINNARREILVSYVNAGRSNAEIGKIIGKDRSWIMNCLYRMRITRAGIILNS